MPLDKDLQKSKSNLKEFAEITTRVISYLQDILSDKKEKGDYYIYVSNIAGTKKYIRPINKELIIFSVDEFNKYYSKLEIIFKRLYNKTYKYNSLDNIVVDKTIYTIQQIIGAGLDLLVDPNSARKHVGNRFEELIRAIFNSIGISNKRIVLQIPYETAEGIKVYKCENDIILSPFTTVKSTNKTLHPKEIVVSAKTTSKDRMGKMFMDKMLLEKFIGHPQKVLGIFLNDVQRKEGDNISYTLVSGLFMIYTKFLTKLEGVYYIDPPPNALKAPYNQYMKRFSNLILTDIKQLLSA
jgi:hypothetical protein